MGNHLKIKFYQLFDREISIDKFEQWIYENAQKIEKEISEEFYLDLISFNFKSKFAKQEFFTTFDEKINWRDYEERKLNRILDSIIHKDEKIIENLIYTYELRNAGCWFLEDLGMLYGLYLIIGFDSETSSWKELSKLEKEKFISENYQEVKESALQVKEWIKDKKIVLTGKRGGELNRYIYSDNRKRKELSKGELGWILEMEYVEKTEKRKSSNRWWQIWKKQK